MRIFNYFISEELRERYDTRLKARALVGVSLCSIVIYLISSLLLFAVGTAYGLKFPVGYQLIGIALLISILSLVAIKYSGSVSLAGNVYLIGYYGLVILSFFHSTAAASMHMTLFCLPVLGFMISGIRAGIFWLVLSLSTHIVLMTILYHSASLSGVHAWQIPVIIIVIVHGILAAPSMFFVHLTNTMQRQLEDERNTLDHLAHHDTLTTLANRSAFEKVINAKVSQALRSQASDRASQRGVSSTVFALIYLDLNDFKPINDRYGHHAGDEVLKVLAKRIRYNIREADITARLGGDEFAIIIDGIGEKEETLAIAKNIAKIIKQPMDIGGKSLQVSASIGVAVFPLDSDSADGLWRKADQAMYADKASSGATGSSPRRQIIPSV